jgi:hypothetical protein
MVTVNEQEDVLPSASVAVNVFIVLPFGKKEPLDIPAVWLNPTPGQLSLATGSANEAVPAHWPGAVVATTLAGQLMVGASLSVTVIVKEQIDVFPAASVAWNTLSVFPFGNPEPLARPLVCEIVVPGQLSPNDGFEKVATPVHNPAFVLID